MSRAIRQTTNPGSLKDFWYIFNGRSRKVYTKNELFECVKGHVICKDAMQLDLQHWATHENLSSLKPFLSLFFLKFLPSDSGFLKFYTNEAVFVIIKIISSYVYKLKRTRVVANEDADNNTCRYFIYFNFKYMLLLRSGVFMKKWSLIGTYLHYTWFSEFAQHSIWSKSAVYNRNKDIIQTFVTIWIYPEMVEKTCSYSMDYFKVFFNGPSYHTWERTIS